MIMAGETQIVVVGNLTADPELRFTNSGVALASFTIASTPRTFDRQKNEWVDGEALFLRCTVWREYAENVANSLTKGMRVIARGNLHQKSFETKEGEKRTSYELDVDEIGPSLRYSTAQVTRTQSKGGSKGTQGGFNGGSQADWANTSPGNSVASGGGTAPGGFGGGFDDEQPF